MKLINFRWSWHSRRILFIQHIISEILPFSSDIKKMTFVMQQVSITPIKILIWNGRSTYWMKRKRKKKIRGSRRSICKNKKNCNKTVGKDDMSWEKISIVSQRIFFFLCAKPNRIWLLSKGPTRVGMEANLGGICTDVSSRCP